MESQGAQLLKTGLKSAPTPVTSIHTDTWLRSWVFVGISPKEAFLESALTFWLSLFFFLNVFIWLESPGSQLLKTGLKSALTCVTDQNEARFGDTLLNTRFCMAARL